MSSFLPMQDSTIAMMSRSESKDQSVTEASDKKNEATESSTAKVSVNDGVEAKVKTYFKNSPILIKIAECESHFRHYGKNGLVLTGVVNSDDVGVMQINKRFHLEDSKKLGHDITTLDGNLAYAKALYEKDGSRPWVHSSACWGEYKSVAMNTK